MDLTIIGTILIILFLFLLFIGVHMGVAFLLIGILGSSIIVGFQGTMTLLSETLYSSIATPIYCVLPLFLLMGSFASRGGFAELAYRNVHTIMARLPGALAIATTFGCAAFASICGATLATVTVFGRLAYPEMVRYNYKKSFALGSIACSGSFAAMIPPSGMFILFAIFTDQSVGKLFLSGIFPGFLTAVVYAITMYVRAKLWPDIAPIHPEEYEISLPQRIHSIFKLWPIYLLSVLVVGGIYTGIFTANESAAIGVVGTFIFGIFNKKLLNIKSIHGALNETARSVSMLFFIIITAMFFSRFLALTRIPNDLTIFLASWDVHPHFVLALIIFIWFILGMLIMQAAVFAMTLPILFPVVVGLGYDPIWFCVVAMKLNEISGISPPVGLNSFVLAGTTNTRVEDVFKGVYPYILADIFVIILLFLFPWIATFLPNSMF